MKPNCSGFEDGGFAGVVSGVGRTGIPDDGRRRIVLQLIVFDKEWWFSPDDKMALCFAPVLGDHSDPTTWRLVRHNLVEEFPFSQFKSFSLETHLIIVVPEDVRWRLRAEG